MSQGRVLFICTQNACRCQMAEAFARRSAPKDVSVRSAGTAPAQINPLALATLREMGAETKGLRAKSISELDIKEFDLIVTLCDRARQNCPVFPGAPLDTSGNAAGPRVP